MTPADLDPRRQALLLYFQGYRIARIAEMLGEKAATVHSPGWHLCGLPHKVCALFRPLHHSNHKASLSYLMESLKWQLKKRRNGLSGV
jgi:hypothetical protein